MQLYNTTEIYVEKNIVYIPSFGYQAQICHWTDIIWAG
jgi:hypothetical protein